jgi:hypothetical protein
MGFIVANAKGAKFQLPVRVGINAHCTIWCSGRFCAVRINIGGRMRAITTSTLFGGFLVGAEWPNPEFDGLTIVGAVCVHIGDGHG